MNSMSSKLLLFLGLTILTCPLRAETISESAFLLREAMMQSNADYNKFKKIENTEEFDRADEWGERDSVAIGINNPNSDEILNTNQSEEIINDFSVNAREISSSKSQ
jgi:hypothetical protein